MSATAAYVLFQSGDGLWRANFTPRIAKVLGPAATCVVKAPSKGTANEIAGILASDALKQLSQRRITKCKPK